MRDFTSPEWEETRKRLDHGQTFARMRNTPYYRDAVYPQFSRAEYDRRFAALRAKMADHDLDVVICPGGPSHWSWSGGMGWLSGHWEWHCSAVYVVVPRAGEPTLIYGMGGTHIEAVRREVAVAISDVRSSRNGLFAEVMAERITEAGAEKGRIGLLELDPRHKDYMPANQYLRLKDLLPGAEIVFTEGFMHELVVVKSDEELDCVRHAGRLCTNAMQAIADRARPGVTEQDLRAAAGAAILDRGGDIDFLIIGSTPMDDPAMVFGNPRPSLRELSTGDIIIMELAAGYRGYSAQIGQPICLGAPPEAVQRFWDEIAKPGYERVTAAIEPGRPVSDMVEAAGFFRANGCQSRPIVTHGIDFVSDGPHAFIGGAKTHDCDAILKPGMVLMPEPNPITADGLLGMFVGHTFIVTEHGRDCVDDWPLELTVV
ncbi:MAG: Xaa-Pro aminopeptidase [Rhodobacteraceae bacterium HLUCCA08]|nr:MAG: Xaa-Pro aminopeptidase [Rhodobacteraceae bacterium HLUCCA08]